MRCTSTLLAALALVGCTCAGEPPPSSVAPPSVPGAPRIAVLPSTARTDLPVLAPAITITVEDAAFTVSNRALVASWPAAEREAVGRTRPLGDAEYPVVERRVDDASLALVVPPLGEAMRALVAVETARAAIVHADGTTQAFLVRAGPDVAFGRVLAAVYAAAMVGLSQPRLALASEEGERELWLTVPRAAVDDPAAAAAVASALAALEGREAPPAIDAGPGTSSDRVTARLGADGLDLRRGTTPLAPGCACGYSVDAWPRRFRLRLYAPPYLLAP